MLDKTVKNVKELFALQSKVIKLADRIVIHAEGCNVTPARITEYRLLRKELDQMKESIKKNK